MKAKVRIPVIIVASVLAALIVLAIVLGCISIKPLSPFVGYDSVRITTNAAVNPTMDLAKDSKDEAATKKASLDKGLEKTRFSVLHALMEFVYGYAPKFDMIDDPDSEDKKPPQIKNELTVDQMKGATQAVDGNFVLEFRYDAEQSIKVEKETVRFDRMRMIITSTNNEVHQIKVYPYLFDMTFGENNADVTAYRIIPVVMRLNLTQLYTNLTEIVKAD